MTATWGTVPVQLDSLAANQLLAAAEQRILILEAHVTNGTPLPVVASEIAQTIRGMAAIREAFGYNLTAHAHEAQMAVTFTADCDELELRALYGDR